MFVAAVSIAAICGTSIGGVLAERLGYRAVLVISAFAAVSGFVIFAVSQRSLATSSAPQANFRLADLKPLLRNRRFMSLMLGAAIPAKISLAGFLFFLTPLGLQAADYSPAAIGRAIMLYYILLTLSNPLASYLSDRWQRHLSLVLGGMLLIGLPGLWLDLALHALCCKHGAAPCRSPFALPSLRLRTPYSEGLSDLRQSGYSSVRAWHAAPGGLVAGAISGCTHPPCRS